MFFQILINFFFHIDKYIGLIISNYGVLAYLIIFAIIFCETGLVVAPFLPGDSLLFIVGAFAAAGFIKIFPLFIIISLAAILGDSLNYWIGNYFGKKIAYGNRFVKKEHLQKTENFYHKYGGKTILLARFIPVMRTLAPFVAGVGKMNYSRFFVYNVVGGLIWTILFLFAGYLFGGTSIVKNNLNYVILLIIFISLTPIIIELLKRKKN